MLGSMLTDIRVFHNGACWVARATFETGERLSVVSGVSAGIAFAELRMELVTQRRATGREVDVFRKEW